MDFIVTTSDAIECIKNLKKIRHDGMQFDACLSKAISDLEEFEEYKKKYGRILNCLVAEPTALLQKQHPEGFDNWHSLHRKEGDI